MANSGKLISVWDYDAELWITFGNKWNDPNFPNEKIRTPSDYQCSSSTIVDSARNSQGQVVSDVIQSDVIKIELTWNFLTVEEFAVLCGLFNDKLNGSFINGVCFYNAETNSFEGDNTIPPNTTTNKVRLFYPNDRVGKVAHITLDANGKPIGYTNVSLHLIDTCRKWGQN